MRVYQFRHQGKPMGAVDLVEAWSLVNYRDGPGLLDSAGTGR